MRSETLLTTIPHAASGGVVEIHQDENPESPREWDNLGTMVCWHRRYRLGDKHQWASPADFMNEMANDESQHIILPLWLYDHSGVTMRVGGSRNPFHEDSGSWDSGQVGWIYVTEARIRKEYSVPQGDIPADIIERAEGVLRNEVETYNTFLTGGVVGFVVKDKSGNEIDSCWLYFTYQHAIDGGANALDYHMKKEAEAEAARKAHERECYEKLAVMWGGQKWGA